MLLGDSLTQGGWEPGKPFDYDLVHAFNWRFTGGFAQRLAYVYARKFDVVNRGLSGYNTEWAIPVFEEVDYVRSKARMAADFLLSPLQRQRFSQQYPKSSFWLSGLVSDRAGCTCQLFSYLK